jgi:hypothetical protein
MKSQKYITPPASTPASSSIVLHSLPTVLFYRPQFSAGLMHRSRQSSNPGKAYILLWRSYRTYCSGCRQAIRQDGLRKLLTAQQKFLFCGTLNAGVSQSHWSVYEYISTALFLVIQRTPRKPSNTPASRLFALNLLVVFVTSWLFTVLEEIVTHQYFGRFKQSTALNCVCTTLSQALNENDITDWVAPSNSAQRARRKSVPGDKYPQHQRSRKTTQGSVLCRLSGANLWIPAINSALYIPHHLRRSRHRSVADFAGKPSSA